MAGSAAVGAGDEDQVVARATRQAPRAEPRLPGASDRVAISDLGDLEVLGPGPRVGPGEAEEPVHLGEDLPPVGLALGCDHGEPCDRRRVRHVCMTGRGPIRYGDVG